MMFGAVIGDIVGSRFEFDNHRSKQFEMFAPACFATDDTYMTCAIAQAIMRTCAHIPMGSSGYDFEFHNMLAHNAVISLRDFGQRYPNVGYGEMFKEWLHSSSPRPYNSFGNGAAMRISPIGFAASSEEAVMDMAKTVTQVTHNHAEGIKGAQAVASTIYLARRGALKSEIREYVARHFYNLDFQIDDIRLSYKFSESCQTTVPQAIECFLESYSFEDSIRLAISLGGDSDTLAAITGSMAQAYYGIPCAMINSAMTYLDDELRGLWQDWQKVFYEDLRPRKVFVKYLGKLKMLKELGDFYLERSVRNSLYGVQIESEVVCDEFCAELENEIRQFFWQWPELKEQKGYERLYDVQNSPHTARQTLRRGIQDGSLEKWLLEIAGTDIL